LKIAVISDIHGNLEALQAVLTDIAGQKADKIFCLGDIVGYGPYPRECLILARARSDIIIRGNHEEGVINQDSEPEFKEIAIAGLRFSRERLMESDFEFLKSLPVKIVIKEFNIALAHGAYTEPSVWKYLEDEDAAKKELEAVPARMLFVGHTHEPYVFGSRHGLYGYLPDDFVLAADERFVINVGSVGQPRDDDCRACYGLLDIRKNSAVFDLRHIFYDISKTAAAIKQSGLPMVLAERLYRGE